MRSINKTSIGLDIGARFIKFVELKRAGETVVLNRFDIKEIPSDAKDRDKVILQLISQILSDNNIKARNVNIAAGGQSVFIRFIKLIQLNKDKLNQTMKFEAQNHIPFSLSEVAWDWSLLSQDNKTRRAVIVAIKKGLLDNIISKLKNLKLSVRLVDVVPIALYNCVVFNEDYDKNKLNAIIDIGAKVTNLIICKGDNIWMRTFPVSSELIEQDKDRGIGELIGEIDRSLEYYFMQGGEGPSRENIGDIILSGGGTVNREIESRLSDKFKIKPKALDPFRKLKVDKGSLLKTQDKYIKSQLAIAIGIALRGMTDLKIQVNFLKEIISEKYVLGKKNIYNRLSMIVGIIIAASFFIFVRQDYSTKKFKLDKIEEMLGVYRTYEPKIKEMQESEEVLKSRINILYSRADSRDLWLDISRIISNILPEDVWITDVSAIISLEQEGIGRLDITGKAFSYQSVNNFVSALKSSPSFSEVKPISSSVETDDVSGKEIVKFIVTMDVAVSGS